MPIRRSTSAANGAIEEETFLRSGQVQFLAWCSPAVTRKRLCLLPTSGAILPQPYLCRANDYVSARAEARSNSNVAQNHTRSVPLITRSTGEHGQRIEKMSAILSPLRSVPVGPARNRMAAAHPATPNPSIEGMPKRLRLSVTPHVKR